MKKILFLFLFLFWVLLISTSWAANKTCYVNTDNTSGTHDGTTQEHGYLTMSEMEDAEDGGSYDAGEALTIYFSGATPDTTAVSFEGWDSDVRFIFIGDWTGDKWDTQKYHLEVNGYAFASYYKFTMSCMQIKTSNQRCVTIGPYHTGSTYIDRCFFWASGDYGRALYINDDQDVYVSNSFIYGVSYSTDGMLKLVNQSTGHIYLENLSIVGSGANSIGTGIAADASTDVTVKNVLFKDCTIDASGTITDTYCATDNANTQGLNASGTGNRFSQTFTFTSTTATTTGFLHLTVDDGGAKDFGTSSISGSYDHDVDNDTRSGTWDIGADEISGGGSGASSGKRLILSGVIIDQGVMLN